VLDTSLRGTMASTSRVKKLSGVKSLKGACAGDTGRSMGSALRTIVQLATEQLPRSGCGE